MKNFKSKTGETVEAMQLVSSPAIELEILVWAKSHGINIVVEHDGGDVTRLRIPTTGGDYVAISGDWIIRDDTGEFLPCGPRRFESTYKAVT